MNLRISQDAVLGILVLLFGLFVALVWAPLDSDTGIVEKVRGRWAIGDALAPTIAGALLAISGLALALRAWSQDGPRLLEPGNFRYLLSLAVCIGSALLVMRYAGPLFTGFTVGEYRPLRDTAPWKYTGFVLGSGLLIAGVGFIMEGSMTWRRAVLILLGVLALALAYDLPFEDLLLPPNADV